MLRQDAIILALSCRPLGLRHQRLEGVAIKLLQQYSDPTEQKIDYPILSLAVIQ
jgi:hypothetical protein